MFTASRGFIVFGPKRTGPFDPVSWALGLLPTAVRSRQRSDDWGSRRGAIHVPSLADTGTQSPGRYRQAGTQDATNGDATRTLRGDAGLVSRRAPGRAVLGHELAQPVCRIDANGCAGPHARDQSRIVRGKASKPAGGHPMPGQKLFDFAQELLAYSHAQCCSWEFPTKQVGITEHTQLRDLSRTTEWTARGNNGSSRLWPTGASPLPS